jgi:hypothetical protein
MAKQPAFEGSKWDKDKGVKEGSRADIKRDKAERKVMAKDLKKKKGK